MNARLPFRTGRKESRDITVLPEGSRLKGLYTIGAPFFSDNRLFYRASDGSRPVIIMEIPTSDKEGIALLEQYSFWAEQMGPTLTQELLELFELSGYRYLVLEAVEGKSLASLISPINGVFLQEKIITEWAPLLYRLFSSLWGKNRESLYGNVIPWQCLVKPDHIMHDREGRFRVILMGMPVLHTDRQSDAQSFAPPEMSESRECDARSLVYIAGAILYYLITNGHERVTGTSSPRSINTRVSPHLEKVLGKALAGLQALRFQSIEEMESFHISRETHAPKPEISSVTEDTAPIISQKGLVYHVDTPADHAAESDFRKWTAYVGIFTVVAICILFVIRGWLGAIIAREKAPPQPSTAVMAARGHSKPHLQVSPESSAPNTDAPEQTYDTTSDMATDPFIASPPFGESAPQPTAEAPGVQHPAQQPVDASAPSLPGAISYPMAAQQQKTHARPGETESPKESLAIVPVSKENTKYFLTPREQILAGLLKRRATDFQEPEGRSTGRGTVMTGQSATSASSNSKEPSFEITVPPGYYQIKSSKKNYLEFATVDKGSQDISLRLLLIRPMALPLKATPEQALALYCAGLEQKGANDVKMGESYVGDKLAYGFNYSMRVSLFDEPLYYSETFYLSKDSNTVYIITASAPKSVFPRYASEFGAFVNSFKEKEY
jgi:hypothetical protein